MTPSPAIAIFNVKHSPNLGDGLLAECLEAELRAACPGLHVVALDLAGRGDYGAGGGMRRVKLAVLERLPRPLRRYAAGLALSRLARQTLAPLWRQALASVDAVIVGGGNLFADADLNFPIKIATAIGEANRLGLPVAVHAVGVSDNWSDRGAALFNRSLAVADLAGVTVRDERSRAAWNRLLDPAHVPRAGITIDPGLLTALHFPAPPRETDGRPHIALGLTDPLALRYHGGGASDQGLTAWFADLVGHLAERSCRISLFTNGSPEDRRFLARIAPILIDRAPGHVVIAPGSERPAGFARFIAGCDLVMAHRMHACIAAYAYRIPTIGFSWDVKLQSFFDLSDRASYILDPAVTPRAAAAAARSAMEAGIPAERHGELVDRCRRDIAALAARIADRAAGANVRVA